MTEILILDKEHGPKYVCYITRKESPFARYQGEQKIMKMHTQTFNKNIRSDTRTDLSQLFRLQSHEHLSHSCERYSKRM